MYRGSDTVIKIHAYVYLYLGLCSGCSRNYVASLKFVDYDTELFWDMFGFQHVERHPIGPNPEIPNADPRP